VALFSSAKSYSLPQFNTVQVNGTVLGFTFALAIAAVVSAWNSVSWRVP
jgi:hypothetical protein